MGDVGADFDVVELLFVDGVGYVLAATIPGHFVARVALVDVGRHVGHLARCGVATHEADAGDAFAAEGQHAVQRQGVERAARVGPEEGAVAPRTTARTARQVDGQGGFVGDLLEDDVGIQIL